MSNEVKRRLVKTAEKVRPIKDYVGHEQDPFLARLEEECKLHEEGIYFVTFQDWTADAVNPDREIVWLLHVTGILKAIEPSTIVEWKPIEPFSFYVRLVRMQGRSGFFLRRLSEVVMVPGAKATRERPTVTVELDELKGIEVAMWLTPEADGVYIRDMAGPGDAEAVTYWRTHGLLT